MRLPKKAKESNLLVSMNFVRIRVPDNTIADKMLVPANAKRILLSMTNESGIAMK